jgi:hypothetical protein
MKARFQSAVLVIAVLAVVGSPRILASPEDDAKAAAIMKQVREALGGEAKLASLQALSLRAEFRREATAPIPGGGATFVMMGGGGSLSGGGQVSGTLAIDISFPDKFYREESSTGGLSLNRIDGFEGDRPFLDITSNSPGTRIMASPPADDPERVKAALKRTNTDLARLLLGLVAGTHAAMPVTYAYAGQAESPDTVADMIDVTGPNDFKARLFIDQKTDLPLMLTYVEQERQPVRMTMPRGEREGHASDAPRHAPAPGAAGLPPGLDHLSPEQRAALEKRIEAAQAAPPKMVEYRMFFSDYREVGGLRLPHEISRATAEKTTEDWQVKEYKVNPDIKADRFKVGAK